MCPNPLPASGCSCGLMPWATPPRFPSTASTRAATWGPCLPFEVDITGLVTSTTNQLAVVVRDDTCFSVFEEGRDRHNRKSWIPRGMGANNRKGLYQSVTLLARPVVHIADARIQTSVRQKALSITWELFNGRKETVHAPLYLWTAARICMKSAGLKL